MVYDRFQDMRAVSHMVVPWLWVVHLYPMWTRGFAITLPKTHLFPLGCILLSQPVYFSLDLRQLDSSATFILSQLPLGGLSHSQNSHEEAYLEGWTLVAESVRIFYTCARFFFSLSEYLILFVLFPISCQVNFLLFLLFVFYLVFSCIW